MKKIFIFGLLMVLTACNSVYVKPGALIMNKDVYADRGGYTMKRSIKEAFAKRGYNVKVGRLHTTHDSDDVEIESNLVPTRNAYIIRVKEKKEIFRPVWCMFNGFWWWRFNVSIADQDTGQEIMSWRGRGCANSSMRKLEKILDSLESRK